MAIQIDGWSVSPRYRKCKKSDCEVCANGKGHGPYYIGTKRENGKTISRYFGTTPPNQDDVQMTYTSDVQNDVYTIDEEQAVQIEALKQQNRQLQADLDQFRPLVKQLLADRDKQTDQIKAQLHQIDELNGEISRLRATQTNKQSVAANSPKPPVHDHYQVSNDVGRALSESVKNIEARIAESQPHRPSFRR